MQRLALWFKLGIQPITVEPHDPGARAHATRPANSSWFCSDLVRLRTPWPSGEPSTLADKRLLAGPTTPGASSATSRPAVSSVPVPVPVPGW